jgi:hypothetical protein
VKRAALVLALAACGGSTVGPDGQTGPIDRHLTVAARKSAEVNLDMPAGSRVTATYTASAPVAWNVHSHPGDQVVIHQEGVDATGTLEVAPATGSAYSLLWENQGEAAIELDLHVELDGGASVISWLPR